MYNNTWKYIIATLCGSLLVSSVMLLIVWLLEPSILALEKFLSPHILVSYCRQTMHWSVDTRDLSWSSISARSHATDAPSHESIATCGTSPLTLAFSTASRTVFHFEHLYPFWLLCAFFFYKQWQFNYCKCTHISCLAIMTDRGVKWTANQAIWMDFGRWPAVILSLHFTLHLMLSNSLDLQDSFGGQVSQEEAPATADYCRCYHPQGWLLLRALWRKLY